MALRGLLVLLATESFALLLMTVTATVVAEERFSSVHRCYKSILAVVNLRYIMAVSTSAAFDCDDQR
jgi:hypothetical protein